MAEAYVVLSSWRVGLSVLRERLATIDETAAKPRPRACTGGRWAASARSAGRAPQHPVEWSIGLGRGGRAEARMQRDCSARSLLCGLMSVNSSLDTVRKACLVPLVGVHWRLGANSAWDYDRPRARELRRRLLRCSSWRLTQQKAASAGTVA